jgi:hypothetical protein
MAAMDFLDKLENNNDNKTATTTTTKSFKLSMPFSIL